MEALEDLLAGYVPRVRAQLVEMRGLLAAGDAEAAGRRAHKIAGVAGSYGLVELGEQARAIERALEGGAPAEAQLERVGAMLDSLPPVAPAREEEPKILVLGEAEGPDVIATTDPRQAFVWAMDRPLRALVVPYRRGRSLLLGLASLDTVEGVPIVLTEVGEEGLERARIRLGARLCFEGPLDEAALGRIRELLP